MTIEIPDVVESIEEGFLRWASRPFWSIHFAVRATAIPGSTRCGPAVTSIDHYMAYSPGMMVNEHHHSFCYVDIAVNEYLIGNGPARLTATMGENPFQGSDDSECDDRCRRNGAEEYLTAGIEGVEWILLLGGPRKLGQGAWHIFGSYDVQRKLDGTAVVVRRYKGEILKSSKPENYYTNLARLERPLDEFRDLITAAFETFVQVTGGRTGTVNDRDGRLPPKLAAEAGPAGFDEFLVRTKLIDGTPSPPPPVPGENDPNPDGLTVNDIIATRVAGGVAIPGGLEGTATTVSALGDEPTATATEEPTATEEAEPTATPTVVPTATPEAVPTPEPEDTPTPEAGVVPTATPEAAPTPEPEPTPTETPEPVVDPTDTPTPDPEPTPTDTPEPVVEPTATATPEPVVEPTATPEDAVATDTPEPEVPAPDGPGAVGGAVGGPDGPDTGTGPDG